MSRRRHPQYCPVARVSELLGHRWVLLLLRELFVGPQRFVDLRRRLSGISPSVLTERLAALEAAGILVQRDLPPPAASSVYELTELGRSFEPAFLELVRFGVRLMGAPEPDDVNEPDWLRLVVPAFARASDSPPRRIALHVRRDGPALPPPVRSSEALLRIAGGPDGTRLLSDDADDARDEPPMDVTLTAPVRTAMALMAGAVTVADLEDRSDVAIDGDANALADLPAMFDLAPTAPQSSNRTGEPR